MRTVLVLLVLPVVVAGLGYYRGWFNFSAHNGQGKPAVTLSVNKDKIEADTDQVVGNVQDLEPKAAAKIVATPQKALD